VADAEAALRRKPATPDLLHNLACIFAQAAGKAQDDPALAGRYRGRAVELLRQALLRLRPEERGPYWRDKVLTDTTLASIRPSSEFQRLGEQFAGAKPPP
jgi:hypothetical protein